MTDKEWFSKYFNGSTPERPPRMGNSWMGSLGYTTTRYSFAAEVGDEGVTIRGNPRNGNYVEVTKPTLPEALTAMRVALIAEWTREATERLNKAQRDLDLIEAGKPPVKSKFDE